VDFKEIPYDDCSFVLPMSPRRALVNDFKKPPPPQEFCMPVWTVTELEAIAPWFPDASEWRNRFDILGGIPRHVLEATNNDPTELLRAAWHACTLDDCIKITSPDSTITEKSKVIHAVVHIASAYPYTEDLSSVVFASQTALDILAEKHRVEIKKRLRSSLEPLLQSPITAALSGHIFEHYALELLEKGGTFRYRGLAHGNKRKNRTPKTMKLVIPASTRLVAEKILPRQTAMQLHVPKTRNFTAIDAWIPGIGAFQATVSKTHDIKGALAEDLAMLGDGAHRLFWLVPPPLFDSFTKKNPQEIDQYAVKVPFPTVIEKRG
jgi:hypothetical protein